MANIQRRTILYRIRFKSRVSSMRFSPCGQFIAVALEFKNLLQLWRTPSYQGNREFAALTLHRTFSGHFDRVMNIEWSPDRQWLLTASKDMTCRLYTREPQEDYVPITMAGHRDTVIGAWWSQDGLKLYSVSRDGACFTWQLQDPLGKQEAVSLGRACFPFDFGTSKIKLTERQYFNQQSEHGPAKVRSAQFHPASNILVVGFSHGVFGLWEMPEMNNIHTLRYTDGGPVGLLTSIVSRKRNWIRLRFLHPVNGWLSLRPSWDSCSFGNGSRKPTFSSSRGTTTT